MSISTKKSTQVRKSTRSSICLMLLQPKYAGLADGEKITSFLIECLVWNVPNNIITGYSNWTTILRQAIIYLYNAINDNKHLEWGEVSEHLYLFKARKWTDEDAKFFLLNLWKYTGYGDESN